MASCWFLTTLINSLEADSDWLTNIRIPREILKHQNSKKLTIKISASRKHNLQNHKISNFILSSLKNISHQNIIFQNTNHQNASASTPTSSSASTTVSSSTSATSASSSAKPLPTTSTYTYTQTKHSTLTHHSQWNGLYHKHMHPPCQPHTTNPLPPPTHQPPTSTTIIHLKPKSHQLLPLNDCNPYTHIIHG